MNDDIATDQRTPRDPGDVRTYYDRPVVKEPEWTWEVPCYLFFGGLAGSSSALAAVAQLTGHRALARRMRTVAAAGAAISPPLLIADLGRPKRFLNMLRVFKPTSVMSVGSWVLAAYSGASIGSAGLTTLGRLPRLRGVADAAAGVLGTAMTTYTGALVADTSIPAWHEARRELPALFASSGVMSAGAAGILVNSTRDAGPARRAAVIGATSELAVDMAMRRRLGDAGDVYEHGAAGHFHRAAKLATAAGGLLVAVSGRRRPWELAGAVALLVGGFCQRWAVYKAGFESARDPRATIAPQRARLERGEGHRSVNRSFSGPDVDPRPG